jgi:hypothetical protein
MTEEDNDQIFILASEKGHGKLLNFENNRLPM